MREVGIKEALALFESGRKIVVGSEDNTVSDTGEDNGAILAEMIRAKVLFVVETLPPVTIHEEVAQSIRELAEGHMPIVEEAELASQLKRWGDNLIQETLCRVAEAYETHMINSTEPFPVRFTRRLRHGE